MKKIGSVQLILFFTVLTVVLTWLVIFSYESYLRRPFYVWVEARYSDDKQLQDQIEQRVEHFYISTTVDVIVVTLLLGLVKRQQRRLRDSEERYRALFEHAGDGIGIVTAIDHRLVDANMKFGEILGNPYQALLGKQLCEVLCADEAGPQHPLLSRVLGCDSGSDAELESNVWSEEVELSVRTVSGCRVSVSAACSQLSTGKQRFFILIIRDLTERKRLERERQEFERQLFQQSKLASIGELSAGVAHEINNPLNCIVNFAQLLKDDGVARNDIERQMVDGIIDEGERIARIVRDLLTFARQDPSMQSRIEVGQVIHHSVSLFGRQLERDGIRLQIEAGDDILPVRADASRLRQVVVNMISNAHHELKGKEGGEKVFSITACNVERAGERIVRLEFYDNGRGIPRENVDKIFDPFFTTRRDEGGTGLGLSLSFGIIRSYGGHIWVESEEGSYTRFIVELPADGSWVTEYAESLAGGRRAEHSFDNG